MFANEQYQGKQQKKRAKPPIKMTKPILIISAILLAALAIFLLTRRHTPRLYNWLPGELNLPGKKQGRRPGGIAAPVMNPCAPDYFFGWWHCHDL